MSDSKRRDRGALIALGLSLAAIVIVVWLSQPASELAARPYLGGADYPLEHHGPAEGRWWPELAARDTYAQWIMALLSVVATGISIWAVKLVRDTLVVTRDAVADTRQIGEAQVRAYLTVSGGRYSVGMGSTRYDIKIKNVGQSPARNVKSVCYIDLAGRPGPDREYTSWKSHIAAISSSGEGKVWFFYNIPDNPDFRGNPGIAFPEIPKDREKILRDEEFPHSSIRVAVGWDDVFGRRQNQTFSLHEMSSEKFFADDGAVIRREGDLSSGQTQHYQDNVKPPEK